MTEEKMDMEWFQVWADFTNHIRTADEVFEFMKQREQKVRRQVVEEVLAEVFDLGIYANPAIITKIEMRGLLDRILAKYQ